MPRSPHQLCVLDPREIEEKIAIVKAYLRGAVSCGTEGYLEAIEAIEWLERYFKIN